MSKFAVVGVLNTGIDFALFGVLYYVVGTPVVIANTLAYSTGVLNSYVWNTHWTFSECKQEDRTGRQLPIFFALNIVGLVLSNFAVWLLVEHLEPLMAKACAVILTFIWNFWSSRRFVYKAG